MISIEEKLFKSALHQIESVKGGRLDILDKIASRLTSKVKSDHKANVIFVCTHNSRRSQIAEVSLRSFLKVLQLPEINVFSCGTEKTGIPDQIVHLLNGLGFEVSRVGEQVNVGNDIILSSKTFEDPGLPPNLLAIMVCDHASESCPFVPSFSERISLEFQDPKSADGSPQETASYENAWKKISREMAYLALKLEENIRG